MKDKEWLREKVSEIVGFDLDHRFGAMSDKYVPLYELCNLIDQLDEPEITEHQAWEKVAEGYAPADPQELIDVLTSYYTNDESEITEEQAWNKIAESYPADVRTLVTSFQNFYYGDFIKNPTISKKETVEVPRIVADWIEKNKHYTLGSKIKRMERDEDEKIRGWYNNCKGRHPNPVSNAQETIAKMDLYGYTIEPPKKYKVKVSGELYFVRYDELEVVVIRNSAPGFIERAKLFDNKEEAEKVADDVNGYVEELPEDEAMKLIEGWKGNE